MGEIQLACKYKLDSTGATQLDIIHNRNGTDAFCTIRVPDGFDILSLVVLKRGATKKSCIYNVSGSESTNIREVVPLCIGKDAKRNNITEPPYIRDNRLNLLVEASKKMNTK